MAVAAQNNVRVMLNSAAFKIEKARTNSIIKALTKNRKNSNKTAIVLNQIALALYLTKDHDIFQRL